MQLHELPKSKLKKVQRIARGGKRGTYSGRGVKGQKSRSGRRVRPAARDLILRLPKRRGFKNKPKAPKARVFNLGDLGGVLAQLGEVKDATVNRRTLIAAGLLSGSYRGTIKILGDGEIKHPVVFEGLRVSGSAKAKIEKAGGKITA